MMHRSQINFELQRLLEQELEPGEAMVWSGQPVKRYFTFSTVSQLTAGLLWTGIVLAVLAHSFGFQWPTFERWHDFIVAIFLIPFLLFGFYFLWAPIKERQRTGRTVYAITDRRAFSVWYRRKPLLHSHPFETISQIRIDDRRGGVGDVIIVTGVRVVGEISDADKQGFYHIRNVREVAACLEEQIGEAGKAKSAELGKDAKKDESGKTWDPPLIIKDDVEKSPISGWKRLLLAPLFLLGLAVLVFVVFGVPAVLSWATNTGAGGYIFFLLFFIIVGQVRHMSRAKKSTNWPTAKGVIIESYIRSDDEGGYNPRVRFTYQVDAKEYESSEITTKQRSDTLNRNPAEAIIAQYPEGSTVTVYYDPRHPSYGVLEPGRGSGNWIVLAILLPCLLASGIYIKATWEGIDMQRYGQKWKEIKQTVGLSGAGEEKRPPATVTLPAEQDLEFVGKEFRVRSEHLWVNLALFGDNAVIGDLPNGALVSVYTTKEKWALVQSHSGQSGWVLRQSLEEIEDLLPADTAAIDEPVRSPPDTAVDTVEETPPVTGSVRQETRPPPIQKTYRTYPLQDVQRFFLAVVGGDIGIVRQYLDGGISPDLKRPNSSGHAPLFLAVSHGHDDVALLLIEAGADVNGDSDIGIPLIWAAERCNSVELVQDLIAAGADVNAKARGGGTPLMMAKTFKCAEIEEILVAAGAH